MKKLKFFIVCALLVSCSSGKSIYEKYDTKYHTLSPKQKFLKYSEHFRGSKYIAPALGEEYLYRFDAFDCVTLIETLISMSYSSSWDEFESMMLNTRYHKGIRDIEHRKHFFMADYLNSMKRFIKSYTSELFIKDNIVKKRTVKIDKQKWFKKIHNIEYKKHPINYNIRFVESSKILSHSVDSAIFNDNKNDFYLVTFIPTKDRLKVFSNKFHSEHDCFHIGILIKDKKSKKLLLRHASSVEKKIVDVDFYDYLKDKTDLFAGVSFFVLK